MKASTLMKFVGGMALSLSLWSSVSAADSVITDDMISGKNTFQWGRALKEVTVEEAKAQLEAVKDQVMDEKTPRAAKFNYVFAATATYGRETEGVHYAQLIDKYNEVAKEIGLKIEEVSQYVRVTICIPFFTGIKSKELAKECIEANKDNLTDGGAFFEMAQLIMFATNDLDQAAPYYKRANSGYTELCMRYIGRGEPAKAAEVFWEGAFIGKIHEDRLNTIYQNAIAYEYSKPDFNAAQLKAKLTRVISIYKIKARTWKPVKEGQENPWLNFVGAVQDTVKDL